MQAHRKFLFSVFLIFNFVICFASPNAVHESEFGANKAANVESKKLSPGLAAPKRGVVLVISGVTSCCSAITIDLDKGLLTVSRTGGASSNERQSKSKDRSLAQAEIQKVISVSNEVWRASRRNWYASCGALPCMPSLDFISELWLIDGDTTRYQQWIAPLDEASELAKLVALIGVLTTW